MKVVTHRRTWFACSLILTLFLLGGWMRTAFAGANLDQGSNGTAALPISPIDWINGNAGSSKAHFIEGYSQAYRLDVTGLSGGLTYKVRLAYDIMQGGKHAFDYLTHYSCLLPHNVSNIPFNHPAETVDPLKGLSTGVEFDAPSSLPIPAPSSTGSPVANQPTLSFNNTAVCEKKITIYNGTINSITYVSQGDLATTGNSAAEIEIIFTVGASRDRVLLAWGAHIASAIDWLGNSASEINGSPYHMHFNGLFDLNGNAIGGNSSQDRSLSADAVVNPCEVLNVQCEGLDLCGASVCNPLTALCVNTYVPRGNQCGDPSNTGICEIGGVCTGDSIYCPATANAPDGTPCTDSNACTVNDTCQAGVCQPGTPLVCPGASDQCHDVGTCDPANGICSNPAKADDTPCSDNNACTNSDSCQAGVCTPGTPKVCNALSQCFDAGVCDTVTGMCTNPPKSAGAACGDPGSGVCDNADTCNGAGVCLANHAADGTSCDDSGTACTNQDTCLAGVCHDNGFKSSGTACGDSSSSQCDNADTCDGAGVCLANHKADGTYCGDAGTQCTNQDTCVNGACRDNGFAAVITPCSDDGNQCTNDWCNGSGACAHHPKTAGTPCGDQSSNLCDAPDSCSANGVCLSNNFPVGTICREADPDLDVCDAADKCDASGQCPDIVFDPNRASCQALQELACRTPGFWGTHGGTDKKSPKVKNITLSVIDASDNFIDGKGRLNICGEYITNTTVNDAASALEALCVPVQGNQRLQLARQLTAAALNCVISGGGANCNADGVAKDYYQPSFDYCNVACRDSVVAEYGSCIYQLDCLNQGGELILIGVNNDQLFCQTGTCNDLTSNPCNSGDLSQCNAGTTQCTPRSGTCHDRPVCLHGVDGGCFDESGPAGSATTCNDANNNNCTVIGIGEAYCSKDSCNILDGSDNCVKR